MPVLHPLTEVMVRNQINALIRVHGILETDGIDTREEFRDMMTAAFRHGGLELRSLSDDLGFSHSTVFRWQDGRSAPHPSLWPRIVEWVTKALAKRIEEVERGLAGEGRDLPSGEVDPG